MLRSSHLGADADDAGVFEPRVGQQLPAHLRARAVCADQQVGSRMRAVGEMRGYAAVGMLLVGGEGLVEMDVLFQSGEQHLPEGHAADGFAAAHRFLVERHGQQLRHALRQDVEEAGRARAGCEEGGNPPIS